MKDRIQRGKKAGMYIRGDSLKKILGLSDMSEVWMFAYKEGVEISTIKHYKMFKEWGIKCKSLDEVEELEKLISSYNEAEDIKCIEKAAPMKRVIKYFKTQPETERGRILSDYRDYLKECRELELNLNDERILFPKNLREAHRKTSEEWRSKQKEIFEKRREEAREKEKERQKEMDEKIRERAAMLSQFNYSDGKLLIRAAETCDEILEEGRKMRHCVGSYAGRVAEGWTNIFFVRKVDEPDKPYYTLELSEGKTRKVVQCRAKCNGDMTDEIKAFVEEWEKNIVNGKKSRKREAA